MRNRISALLPAFICIVVFINPVEAMDVTELHEFSSELAKFTCGNSIYRECLNVSEEVCIESMNSATDKCPLRHIERLNEDMPDGVCIASEFFNIAKVPDKIAMSCEKYLQSELELRHETINKTMPNK